MSIKALLSHADGSDEMIDLGDWTSAQIRDDQLLWVDVESAGGDELEVLRRALDLDDREAQALEATPERPAATVHKGAVEVVVLGLDGRSDEEPAALQVIVGDGWIVTNHAGPMPFLDEHRERITDQREVGLLTAVEFLVSMLDWHVDQFFAAATKLEAEVDELDDAALRTDRDLLDRLVAMRRRIAQVRGVQSLHRELYAELARADFLPDLKPGESDALTAVTQRLDRAGEAIAYAREMLIGTFDVHMTRMAQRTNDVMRILTLASVILLPSVVIAGVMGMNFKVAFFDNPDLFWVVIGAMVVLATATLVIARWRGWL